MDVRVGLQKKAECQRIDAFELWCWRRFLRVPWTARGFNQSILKEISPESSLEGLMLKLKLQSFGHLMWITDSLEKTLMLGKIEGGRRREQQRVRGWMASPTQWAWVWVSSGSWWRTGMPGMLQSMGLQRVGHYWANKLDWTENKGWPNLQFSSYSMETWRCVWENQISRLDAVTAFWGFHFSQSMRGRFQFCANIKHIKDVAAASLGYPPWGSL